MTKMPWQTERDPSRYHSWEDIGFDLKRCRKCGLEAKSADIKRGTGRCIRKIDTRENRVKQWQS